MSGGGKGGGGGGGSGPGFISPFDRNAFSQAQGAATTELTNRYQQLGLGATSASPSGPTVGATAGVPGSGTTPTTPGNFGAGPTAMQMDLGQLPSVTGGIPEMFQAGMGQAQAQDLAQSASQQSGNNAKGGDIGQGVGKALGGGK